MSVIGAADFADSLRKAPAQFGCRLGEEEMNVTGVPFLKSSLTVAKIIKPGPPKVIIISKFFNFFLVFEEAHSPFPEGTGIVVSKIVEVRGTKV